MGVFSKLRGLLRSRPEGDFRSGDYWDRRYRKGGTSGAGSYGRLAEFKAEILNRFVAEHNVKTVVEHGCGDGAQLELARYPAYIGFDVAPKAVEMCRERFKNDPAKQFCVVGEKEPGQHDLALSLDVIYHLVEDAVYEAYMRSLLDSSHQYLGIYASNEDKVTQDIHVRHRRFVDFIDATGNWRLIGHVPNRFPFDRRSKNQTSFADFYFFEKTAR